MTDDNRKKNIAIEVERGDESIEAAELLLAGGKYASAVSRAYYAAFHHARALLLTLGEETRTHAGLSRLVHRDLVRGGILSSELGHLFSQLQTDRMGADYAAEVVFTKADAERELAAAQRFVAEARAVLKRGGWTK